MSISHATSPSPSRSSDNCGGVTVIVGIGVDVVDLARFERALDRTPTLTSRIFADAELRSGSRVLPLRSLAGRFAAKEALIKALGDSTGVRWHDMQVVSDESGNPHLALSGAAAAIAERVGANALHLSMSHDGGVAIAYVIAENVAEGRS
jgi:holo-[acyl-carrier protein] synthase